jgi:hypothetical protein
MMYIHRVDYWKGLETAAKNENCLISCQTFNGYFTSARNSYVSRKRTKTIISDIAQGYCLRKPTKPNWKYDHLWPEFNRGPHIQARARYHSTDPFHES